MGSGSQEEAATGHSTAGGVQSVDELDDIMAKKMTADQRELWKRHLLADHQPYRSDCAVCINAQATGRPHRRVKQPTGSALAVDLAGPFKHQGRDMNHRDYRYLLVGAFRFQVLPSSFGLEELRGVLETSTW